VHSSVPDLRYHLGDGLSVRLHAGVVAHRAHQRGPRGHATTSTTSAGGTPSRATTLRGTTGTPSSTTAVVPTTITLAVTMAAVMHRLGCVYIHPTEAITRVDVHGRGEIRALRVAQRRNTGDSCPGTDAGGANRAVRVVRVCVVLGGVDLQRDAFAVLPSASCGVSGDTAKPNVRTGR
jgi:hypothetical protein